MKFHFLAPSYGSFAGDTIFPTPPPAYGNVPMAGQYDPNTGFYNFNQPTPSAPAFNDAPPSYEDTQKDRILFPYPFLIQ